MPDNTQEEMAAYIAELRERARKSQADAKENLNPLFTGKDGERAPRDFVESSFLFMRSWDVDDGSRPMAWPAFWLSPDLHVAPLSHLGARTSELKAGATYRLSATVRNRGDLAVPSAKVEFYLVNPSLGFDTRFATKLGVVAERVQAYSASEVSLDYVVPPSLSGHRCLFARVFAFSPLDIPVDDYALDPRIDRHIAQLNLNIVASASTLSVDWIHHRNAAERLEVVPMTAAMIRTVRVEAITALSIQSGAQWEAVQGRLEFKIVPGEGPKIETRRTDAGLELFSVDDAAVSLDRQAELTKAMLQALKGLAAGGATKHRELFREYRAMTAQSVRTQVALALPDVGLKPGQALALNVIRRSLTTEEVLGGIGVFLTPAR